MIAVRERGCAVAVLAASALLAARADESAFDQRVAALAGKLQSSVATERSGAVDALRKIGAPAIPALLRSAGNEVGAPAWEAGITALAAVDPDESLAAVETCRSQWSDYGWLQTPECLQGRRVVDELEDRLIAARKVAWCKPVKLEPATLDDGFHVPPWAEERVVGTLPSRLAWADVRVRERGGKLEIDAAMDGRFATPVEPERPAVVSVGTGQRARKVLVYRRLDVWLAASPNVLRGTVERLPVELLDVEEDGDFAGPADLIRFGDGAFRPLREGNLAWNGTALVRFRLRRDADGFTISTLPEPEPSWADKQAAAGVAALQRWRAAAGLAPERIDRERSRRCSLHHDYWRRNGFSAHDEDKSKPGCTDDGHLAGQRSSCWQGSDGATFVIWLGATVLHRVSLIGRPEEGVGCFVGGAGSMLWGGDIDASQRAFPVLVPGPGQTAVPWNCEPEAPDPSKYANFYGRARGFPVSVTWIGMSATPFKNARVDVFDAKTKKPLVGTSFSAANPYTPDHPPDDWMVFVPEDPFRRDTLYTAQFRATGAEGPVEFSWQFRTK